MEKEIRITPPDGYEIDKNKSTFDCIKFKPIDDVKNVVDLSPYSSTKLAEYRINNKWAFTIYTTEIDDNHKIMDHGPSMFLCHCHGQWYDENGKEITGYLYYKPTL